MTSGEVAALVPAVLGLVTALTAYLKAQSAHKRITKHRENFHGTPK